MLARAGIGGTRAGAPGVRRDRRDARAALGHDRADRATRRHALPRCERASLRFCYFAHCYRGVRPQWSQPRELLQAGIELIGSPAPQGTAEALTVLCDALDATGLKDYRIGLGDASLFATLMDRLQIDPSARAGLLETLASRDFVELEQRLAGIGSSAEAAALLLSVPQRRGGPEVLDGAAGSSGRRGRRACARSASCSRIASPSG